MRSIYKYPIQITGEQEIAGPISKIIHAGLDAQGTPCVWCEVWQEDHPVTCTIFVVGTGNPMPALASTHIGSFVQGPFVWHVYL